MGAVSPAALSPALHCGEAVGSDGRQGQRFLPPFVLALTQAAYLSNNGKVSGSPAPPHTWAFVPGTGFSYGHNWL